MSRAKIVSKLLRLKEHRKEEAELEVRKIRDMLNLTEANIETIEKKFDESLSEFDKKSRNNELTAEEIGLFYCYFKKLNEEMNYHKKEMIKWLNELSKKQNELIEAYREKKVFEKLKDKINVQNDREREKEEQKDIDFLTITHKKKR